MCQIKVRTYERRSDIALSGKGVVGGNRGSRKKLHRSQAHHSQADQEQAHRKFRKTMTLLYAKGAGAACAERDQY